MNGVGIIFSTGTAIVPIILLIVLALGTAMPIIDYLRARTRAKRQGQPAPGLAVLMREFSESDGLAYFLFAIGIIMVLWSLIFLSIQRDLTVGTVILMVATGLTGCGLIFVAQQMWKRFKKRVRSWRKDL